MYDNGKHPPVQVVQISKQISHIRRTARNTTLTPEERLRWMQAHRQQALEMLDKYHAHWISQSAQLP